MTARNTAIPVTDEFDARVGEIMANVLRTARGASLQDPQKLFNSSLEGNTRRAIDIQEGEKLDEAAFKELILSAVAANSAARARRASPKK